MATISRSAEPSLPLPRVDRGEGAEPLLLELEARWDALRSELTLVEAQLRRLRTAEAVCPTCGGSGHKTLRGGLYREVQTRTCTCAEVERS